MKSIYKIGLISVGSVILGILGAWFVFGRTSTTPAREKGQQLSRSARSGNVKKITEISVDRRKGKRAVRIVESEVARPDVLKNAEIDDEAKLSDVQKSVLKDIQRALDNNDVKALRKALSRFTASTSKGGLGGYASVPRVIRAAAVQALGWFGKEAAVDMIDFMADEDEEISSEAFDQFELAIQDVTMSDFERSALIKTIAKALTDTDRIDTLLMCMMDMRSSVKADTAMAILTNGSSQSKATLIDQMDFYFDDGVRTVDDIKKWVAEHPDDPGDDEFYGGSKED